MSKIHKFVGVLREGSDYGAAGDRVYVDVRIGGTLHAGTGVRHDADGNHVEVPASTPTLGISVMIVRPGQRDCHTAGQAVDALLDVEPAPGWTSFDVKELHRVWKTWHLNDMSARCESMPLPTPDMVTHGQRQHLTCPTTGETYGSRWYVRPLPGHVVGTLLRLAALPSGRIPAWMR